MRRPVFIGNDETELDHFRKIMGGIYEYNTVHWPNESEKLFNSPPPHIFVSDLYLPSDTGDSTPTAAQREEAARAATKMGESFSGLYSDPQRQSTPAKDDEGHRGRLRHVPAPMERLGAVA
jgi:hypothetical protein